MKLVIAWFAGCAATFGTGLFLAYTGAWSLAWANAIPIPMAWSMFLTAMMFSAGLGAFTLTKALVGRLSTGLFLARQVG